MSSPEIVCEYPYRHSLLANLFFFVFFLAISVLSGLGAWNHEGSIDVKGLIELEGIAAHVFLWVCTAFCVGMTLIVGRFLIIRIVSPHQRIAFTTEGILMPRTRWSTNEEFLPFEEIDFVEMETHKGHPTFLHLDTQRGRFSIARQKLIDEDFGEIRSRVMHRDSSS